MEQGHIPKEQPVTRHTLSSLLSLLFLLGPDGLCNYWSHRNAAGLESLRGSCWDLPTSGR